MPRPERVLYASFLRVFRRYRSEGVPLTGLVGQHLGEDARPLQTLRRLFRQPGSLSVEGGLRLLSLLQAQLDTLVSSEEETREALAEWEQLVAGDGSEGAPATQPAAAAAAAAAAAERGMQLLVRQAARLDEIFGAGELAAAEVEGSVPGEGSEGEEEGSLQQPEVGLDGLAEEVRRQYAQLAAAAAHGAGGGPVLLPPAAAAASAAAGQPPPEQQPLLLARALSEVLYARHKYSFRPFEWVYDGLSPLLLPGVLARRRGLPLSLAVLAAAVGRRAGLALTPLPAWPQAGSLAGAGGGAAAGAAAAALEALPPHLASKLASGGQGAPPSQPPWLLRIEGTGGGRGWHYLEAESGEILGPTEAAAKYPALPATMGWAAEGSSLAVWQSLVRTIIQAHQRRGESDLVAHWMYVLLALDPHAEEWRFMLQQPGGGGGG